MKNDDTSNGQGMSNPDHPIWRLLQTIVYLIAAGVFLKMNATSFDWDGEGVVLLEMAVLVFGTEGVKQQLKARRKE